MDKDKLHSFIRLCKRDCVAVVCLAEDFESFMSSPSTDAYEYFCSRGMIQTETLSQLKLAKIVFQEMETPTISLHELVKNVMKRTGGRADPNVVKEIVMEILIP